MEESDFLDDAALAGIDLEQCTQVARKPAHAPESGPVSAPVSAPESGLVSAPVSPAADPAVHDASLGDGSSQQESLGMDDLFADVCPEELEQLEKSAIIQSQLPSASSQPSSQPSQPSQQLRHNTRSPTFSDDSEDEQPQPGVSTEGDAGASAISCELEDSSESDEEMAALWAAERAKEEHAARAATGDRPGVTPCAAQSSCPPGKIDAPVIAAVESEHIR
jgi:hypothetical protein